MAETSDKKQQKVILITGASNGIGEATALEFAKLGHKVSITGRKQDRLDEVMQLLAQVSPSGKSDNFLALRADFENPSEVEGIVAKTVAQFGQLDVLVNNAGFPGNNRGLVDEDFFDDFHKIIQVNLMAATRIAQLATPHLLKTKGVIINVSSIADRIPMPNISYSVSKAGLTMLTKCLANAYSGTGVRVVTVSPGPIKTNFGRDGSKMDETTNEANDKKAENFKSLTLLRRLGGAVEVAETILFLASDKASYITGCTLDIDGGMLANFGGAFSSFAKPLNTTSD